MTQEQAKKKEWLQRCLHETQKLEAMTMCGKYTETECSQTEQVVQQTQREIKCCIAALNNPELEAVLIRRYIVFQSWEQIAEEMHYSVRTIGSPPPMRGKDNYMTVSVDDFRITPAYAGKRSRLLRGLHP